MLLKYHKYRKGDSDVTVVTIVFLRNRYIAGAGIGHNF